MQHNKTTKMNVLGVLLSNDKKATFCCNVTKQIQDLNPIIGHYQLLWLRVLYLCMIA